MKHFLTTRSLSKESINMIIKEAEMFKNGRPSISDQLFAVNLFFEPSTRTNMSFLVAERKLGIETLDFCAERSSITKGETLYDTVRTCEAIGANIAIIRHQDDSWYEELVPNISIPIINAGSGKSEHPTQCMLDLWTIYQEFGHFDGLNIAIAGDIKHSRVARSNAYALKTLGANVSLVAGPGFVDGEMDFPYVTIDEAVKRCDVLMLLRIQHERHGSQYENTSYLEQFGLTKERERKMQEHAIILHPAPVNRGVEIDSDLVECDRSRIFKQMENGVYVRMAIISILLKEWGMVHDQLTYKCN